MFATRRVVRMRSKDRHYNKKPCCFTKRKKGGSKTKITPSMAIQFIKKDHLSIYNSINGIHTYTLAITTITKQYGGSPVSFPLEYFQLKQSR